MVARCNACMHLKKNSDGRRTWCKKLKTTVQKVFTDPLCVKRGTWYFEKNINQKQ